MLLCAEAEFSAALNEIGVTTMARTKKSAETKSAPSVVEAVKEVAESVAAKASTKKAPAEKKVEEVYLQAGGAEWNVTDCKTRIVEAYKAEGHKAADIKKLVIYLKPEEGKAYYVVNDADNGSVGL